MTWLMTAEGTTMARNRLVGTDQQEEFWDAVASPAGGNILLSARAGTGKSASCRESMWRLIEDRRTWPTPPVVRYCCFNKAIADEFRAKCPPGVEVGTMHSFGFRACARAFGSKLEKQKTYLILDTLPGGASLPRKRRKAISRLVSIAKNRAYGPAEDDASRAVQLPHLLDLILAYGIDADRASESVAKWAMDALVESSRRTQIIDFDDMLWLPAAHDLEFPRLDYLFVDECQDLNPVQHALLPQLTGGGRAIVVGDPFQCQPAGTMVEMEGGGRKPIEDIRQGDRVVSWDRRGGYIVGRQSQARRVEATACHPYIGPMLTIAAGGKATRCTPNHRWVARFVDRMPDLWCVYLMRKGVRFRVGWCQLFTSQGSLHLGQRARVERADAAWILSVHRDKTSASIAESLVAAQHGLPLLPFMPVNGAAHLTAESLESFWSQIEGGVHSSRAVDCLIEHGREPEHPFYRGSEYERRGRTTIFETHAANLIPEIMAIPVDRGAKVPEWCPIRIESERFEGTVFSLKVESHETYIADGLVTHNSIYGFRGADCNSVSNLKRRLHASEYPLTRTFRCPKSHVELARQLVDDFEAADGNPEGVIDDAPLSDLLDIARPGDLVLCRKNAPLVGATLRALSRRIPAIMRGRSIGEGLVDLVNAAEADTTASLIKNVRSWEARQVAALEAKEASDDDIEAVMDRAECVVSIAGECDSIAEVTATIRSLFTDTDHADRITFSSVHRAKGSEAQRVHFIDIPDGKPGEALSGQRRNLRYVAITRSLDRLTFIDPDA